MTAPEHELTQDVRDELFSALLKVCATISPDEALHALAEVVGRLSEADLVRTILEFDDDFLHLHLSLPREEPSASEE